MILLSLFILATTVIVIFYIQNPNLDKEIKKDTVTTDPKTLAPITTPTPMPTPIPPTPTPKPSTLSQPQVQLQPPTSYVPPNDKAKEYYILLKAALDSFEKEKVTILNMLDIRSHDFAISKGAVTLKYLEDNKCMVPIIALYVHVNVKGDHSDDDNIYKALDIYSEKYNFIGGDGNKYHFNVLMTSPALRTVYLNNKTIIDTCLLANTCTE